MELKKLLEIKTGSVITIVGAGGKSTFMYTLAEELRKESKCLVTTTTKIYVPHKTQYDNLAIEAEKFETFKLTNKNGVYVYGSSINEESKLLGIDCIELEESKKYFDYILVEADGSKRKPIKGWKHNEPVVCGCTSKTIGMLSIESLGKEINGSNVHRVEEFLKLTSSKLNDKITIENYITLIFHPRGLFKNSLGEKILFINKVDSNQQWKTAETLLHFIEVKNKQLKLLEKIIIGSLKLKHYKMQRDDYNDL